MVLQSYTGNHIDFCACTALCNALLIMSCCCWSGEYGRGGFSCVLTTSLSAGWEMILWLICIEDGVTEEYHPVTRNHEWQKFGACFTNTLPNEEKCKSTASFGNLDSFSRQWDKKAECLGKSHLFCINLLLLACSLFYSWSEKKNGKDLKPSLWNQSCFVAFVVFTMISLFPLCTSIVPFHIFLGTHTCEDSISWIKVKLLGKSYYLIKTKILLSLSLTLCTECHIKS